MMFIYYIFILHSKHPLAKIEFGAFQNRQIGDPYFQPYPSAILDKISIFTYSHSNFWRMSILAVSPLIGKFHAIKFNSWTILD